MYVGRGIVWFVLVLACEMLPKLRLTNCSQVKETPLHNFACHGSHLFRHTARSIQVTLKNYVRTYGKVTVNNL